MDELSIRVIRRPEGLEADDRRVITRYLRFRPSRIRSILKRLMALDEATVAGLLRPVIEDFGNRHREVRAAFLANYQQVADHIRGRTGRHGEPLTEERRLLIGAYFTLEYSFESAALFNPSIVPHPDQSGLDPGSVRFLMSLRATGEGHVSSIVFRRGVIDAEGNLAFDPPPRFAYAARPTADGRMTREWYLRTLIEMSCYSGDAQPIIDALPEEFGVADLEDVLEAEMRRERPKKPLRSVARDMLWLALANYELRFPADCLPAEIVIFPATESEQHGMEDLRLTRFVDAAGSGHYYGTYTAYDGSRTRPMLLETADFHTFRVRTIGGRYARDKGMALFPRMVGGSYLAVSRHDGENLHLVISDNLQFWNRSCLLQRPAEPWELVQLGNCGSPLETEAGWLLLTHGVGAVRRYCIGALLLDRDDPSRVLGHLREPLLIPSDEERAGYVPNVVYSCGAMIHGDRLFIPYAMSDTATRFATVNVQELQDRLLADGP